MPRRSPPVWSMTYAVLSSRRAGGAPLAGLPRGPHLLLGLGGRLRAGRLLGVAQRGGHEAAVQRVRPVRAGPVLGVELGADEPRVAGQLDDLHQLALRVDARDPEAVAREDRQVVVVHLEAVPVPLLHEVGAV